MTKVAPIAAEPRQRCNASVLAGVIGNRDVQEVRNMRQKIRRPRRAQVSTPHDRTPIDLGDTSRQIALFEVGNGLQHGVLDILVALAAALILLPARSLLRFRTRDRR
jgi:hypothetical protein